MLFNKRLLSLFFVFVFLFANTRFSQVRKIVLTEVFTNSGCGSCATSNEVLKEFYSNFYGGIISVRYHPDFPDPRDPMYAGHSEEIDNRVRYYGILYTPQILFDGEIFGSAENVKDLWQTMEERISVSSPVWIDITTEKSIDSIKTTVKINGYGTLNERDLKLRVALIERNVHYDQPPGANGETDFPDVFRKMLSDTNGIPLSQISEGDLLEFGFSSDVEENWEWRNLSVVAWLQSDATKEIFQSNIDISTLIINSDEPNFREITLSNVTEKEYSIINFSDKSIPIKIKYSTNLFYDNWDYSLNYGNSNFDSLLYELDAHDTLNFSETIATDNHASVLTSSITVENTDDIFPYRFSYKNFAFAESPDLLVVNTENVNEVKTRVLPIIKDSLLLDYTIVSSNQTRYWLDEFNAVDFESGMLLSGDESYSYEDNDIKVLMNIADNGKSVLASGQRILSTRGAFQSSRNFCDNYLDILFVERIAENEISGVTENPITGDLDFVLSGNYQPMPEIVVSKNGNSYPAFTLSSDNTKFVSMQNETENFKTFYAGFGIVEIENDNKRTEFLRRVFRWFGIQPNSVEKTYNVDLFKLYQNYPNPFNPTTEIKYGLAKDSFVQIKLFDVTGREISSIVNRFEKAGVHTVRFNARNLSSGVYFYSLQAGNFISTKKMILLK